MKEGAGRLRHCCAHLLTCITSVTYSAADSRRGNEFSGDSRELSSSARKVVAMRCRNLSYSRCVCSGGRSSHRFRPATFPDQLRISWHCRVYSLQVGVSTIIVFFESTAGRLQTGAAGGADLLHCHLNDRRTSAWIGVHVPLGPQYTKR